VCLYYVLISLFYQRWKKNSSFGFLALAKTKCAVCAVAFLYDAQLSSICKVGDCGLQTYQTETILKRATTVEFTTITPILYNTLCVPSMGIWYRRYQTIPDGAS